MLKLTFLAGIVVTTVTSSLFGQPDCNTVVVDEARIFHGQQQVVIQAARRLMNVGADVRIRTFKTMNSAPTMEIFERSLEAQCSSWKASDGKRKNNLVVLLISFENRKTGLYYGSQWKTALDRHQTRIQTDVMNPRFRNQDFAGGFESGLNEIERILSVWVHTPVRDSELRPVVAGLPEAKEASVDLSGLWSVLYLSLAFCALVITLVFVFRFKKYLDKKKEEFVEAKHRALIADQRVSSLLVELSGEYDRFEAITTEKQVSKEVKSILDSVTESYAGLKSLNVGNPNQKLFTPQYIALACQYEEMREKLERASSMMKGGNPTPTRLQVALSRASQSSKRSDSRKREKQPSPRHNLSAWSNQGTPESRIDYPVHTPIIISHDTPPTYETHRHDVSSSYTPPADSGGGSTSWDSGGSSSSDSSGGGGGDSSW